MQILYSDELGTEARQSGITDTKQVWKHIEGIAKEHTPMYLGMVTAVTYSDKTDRYVAKFNDSTAKVTEEVAAFLIQHAVPKGSLGVPLPTVYANMDAGVITDVTLLFSYKG